MNSVEATEFWLLNTKSKIILKLTEQPEIAKIQNSSHVYPLHTAVKLKLSFKIIEKLIEIYPEAISRPNKEGKLPLHLLFVGVGISCDGCNEDRLASLYHLLYSIFPEAVYCSDIDGYCPLHSAATNSKLSLKLLKIIAHHNLDAVMMTMKDGSNILHIGLQHLNSEAMMYLLSLYPKGCAKKTITGVYPLLTAILRLNKSLGFWTLTSSKEVSEWTTIVCKVLKLFPNAGLVKFQNKTPFHLLCKTKHVDVEIVNEFLNLFPSCATTLNEDREYPFIVASMNWSITSLRPLLEAYPRALEDIESTNNHPLENIKLFEYFHHSEASGPKLFDEPGLVCLKIFLKHCPGCVLRQDLYGVSLLQWYSQSFHYKQHPNGSYVARLLWNYEAQHFDSPPYIKEQQKYHYFNWTARRDLFRVYYSMSVEKNNFLNAIQPISEQIDSTSERQFIIAVKIFSLICLRENTSTRKAIGELFRNVLSFV